MRVYNRSKRLLTISHLHTSSLFRCILRPWGHFCGVSSRMSCLSLLLYRCFVLRVNGLLSFLHIHFLCSPFDIFVYSSFPFLHILVLVTTVIIFAVQSTAGFHQAQSVPSKLFCSFQEQQSQNTFPHCPAWLMGLALFARHRRHSIHIWKNWETPQITQL